MKHFKFYAVLAAALLACPSQMSAKDISLAKAKEVAGMFFTKSGKSLTRSGNTFTLVNAAEVAGTRAGSSPAFYIFNRAEGGFVIVSGIDAESPVLAYSFDNQFGDINEMPEHVAYWLDGYRQHINKHRASGKEATDEELAQWGDALVMTKADGAPTLFDLQTPNFNQGAPYNRFCPVNGDKHAIVGCVPIAISEIVTFYKYPEAGHGTLLGYVCNGVKVPSIVLGHKYQWDKILPTYVSGAYTEEQADAVARLCCDMAVMVKAEFFDAGGTGANSDNSRRLAEYMDYSTAQYKEYRSNFTAEEWAVLLRNYLSTNRPLLYSGGNHCYVVDGYDSDDRFLVNFGWNGQSNGYYKVDSFDVYNEGQVARFNVYPEDGSGILPPEQISLERRVGGDLGLVYASGNVSPGEAFKVYFNEVANNGRDTVWNVKVNVAIHNKYGDIKGWCWDPSENYGRISPGGGIRNGDKSTRNTVIPANVVIERGDYLEPYFKSDRTTEWTRMRYVKDPGATLQGRIICHIEDYSTLEYDKATDSVKVKTFTPTSDSNWDIYNSDNNSVKAMCGATMTDGLIAFKRKALPAGKYKLVSKSGKQTLELELIF